MKHVKLLKECRCPNIHGYPTWIFGDHQFLGFKNPTALRSLINSLETQHPTPVLNGPSEPMIENIPDRIHMVNDSDPTDSKTKPMIEQIEKVVDNYMITKNNNDEIRKMIKEILLEQQQQQQTIPPGGFQ